MTKIFVDTAFWKALVDDKDDFHVKAEKQMEKIRRENIKMITTNFVVDETVTLLRVRCGTERLKDLVSVWKDYSGIKFVRVMAKDELNVWEWIWKDWSKLSYTDCTSFAVMKRLGLTKVATFDDHFQKAGFEVIK